MSRDKPTPIEAAGFRVRAKQCATCIYLPTSPLDIRKLEADVADKHGGFHGHRVCHHSPKDEPMCCRGFWNRHKDKFAMGQIAQRLGWVIFIKGD
jgi:hypothetical protein